MNIFTTTLTKLNLKYKENLVIWESESVSHFEWKITSFMDSMESATREASVLNVVLNVT